MLEKSCVSAIRGTIRALVNDCFILDWRNSNKNKPKGKGEAAVLEGMYPPIVAPHAMRHANPAEISCSRNVKGHGQQQISIHHYTLSTHQSENTGCFLSLYLEGSGADSIVTMSHHSVIIVTQLSTRAGTRDLRREMCPEQTCHLNFWNSITFLHL